ncbi:MAG: macrolide ABC transporter ATP-binding protein [Euryarchaeota archaeon RBG_16_68_12]|nr:MAG: macrolide ABC transporter ATP-binding protein [Euryarchaeota archaeon RBG_16_68_12]
MPEDSPIVRAVNAHKVYNSGAVKVHALQGVDLEIRKGEMVAIMGPSGCGKTTLLNCFSGLDDLTEGQVFIEGVPLNKMSDRAKTRYRALRMGFIFQSYNLLPVLSAHENVELPLLVAGVPPREARARAAELLGSVGLEDFARHKPAELSAGQQQRVAVVRALANRPAIVWADEPTGNLDSETSAQIMQLLHETNRKNAQAFVVVTHDVSISGTADRILRMRNGRIVEETTPARVSA